MMQKRNIRKLLFLGLLTGLSACDSEDSNKDFLTKGVEFFESGEFSKAEIELKNAVQNNPNIADAYYYIALLNEKSRKFKAMRENLLEAVKLDSKHIKAKLKLAKVQLLFKEFDKSLLEINAILLLEPNNLDALVIEASIFGQQKQNDKAAEIINIILAQDPLHVEGNSLKVIGLIKQGASKDALAVLMPIIEKNPDNMTLLLLKMQIDSQLKDIEAVIADYKKLIILSPDNIKVKYALVKVLFQADKKPEAEAVLRKLVVEQPDEMSVKLELLNFLYLSDEKQAITQLDDFIKHQDNKHSDTLVFVAWLLTTNKELKARELLDGLLADGTLNSKDKQATYLVLAKLAINKRNFDEVSGYVTKVLALNTENLDAKLLQAKVLAAQENFADAMTIIEKMLWQKSDMDEALSLRASIHMMQGDIQQADENFREALKFNPKNLAALNFIVNKSVNEQHTDYAIEILERAAYFLPKQVSILNKLITLNIAEKNWEKTDKYLQAVSRLRNGKLFSSYFKAKILLEKGELKDAKVAYQAFVTEYPWHKDAFLELLNFYQQAKQKEQYVNQFIDKNPNVVFAYIVKSQLMAKNKKNKQVISFLNKTLTHKALRHPALYLELVRLYSLSSKKQLAYDVNQEGLKLFPEHTGLKLWLATYYEKEQRFDEAVNVYNDILKKNIRHQIARNNLATILVEQYGKAKDIEQAVQLVSIFKQSKQAYFLDTYAWVLVYKGELEQALSILEQVIVYNGEVPVFHYHLAQAYYKMNNHLSAITALKQALRLGEKREFLEKSAAKALLAKLKQ